MSGITRRGFLKRGIAATAAAFIVPEIIVPERRFWQLDSTMAAPGRGERVRLTVIDESCFDYDFICRWVAAMEPRSTPVLNAIHVWTHDIDNIYEPRAFTWRSPFITDDPD